MPITKSAKKALRQNARKKAVNDARKKTMKEAVKAFKKAPAVTSLAAAYKSLDKAGKKHTIHKNRASRLKSRLAKRLAKTALTV